MYKIECVEYVSLIDILYEHCYAVHNHMCVEYLNILTNTIMLLLLPPLMMMMIMPPRRRGSVPNYLHYILLQDVCGERTSWQRKI